MNKLAPEGYVYVCRACGKVANNLYGDGTRGWDVSCTMNADLFREKDLVIKKDRVMHVTAGAVDRD